MNRLGAEFLLLLTTLIWGGTFAVIKTAVSDISPSAFVLSRFVVALLIAVLLWPRSIRTIDRSLLVKGLVLGALFGSGFILQTIGLTMTTASTSAFITGSMVIFVPFVYWFVERRSIKLIHLITVAFAISGLWLFTRPDATGFHLGNVLTLISAVIWAGYIVCIDMWTKQVKDNKDKQHALVILQFVATVLLAGMGTVLLDEATSTTNWTMALIVGILYCAVLASVVTTWIQTRFQQYTHPVRAGVIFAMEPIFAAIIAWVALSESWTFEQGIGAAILLAAIVVPDFILARSES